MTKATERVHLIVLIHGLYGNPNNLAVVKEELERANSRDDEEEVEDLLDPTSSSSSKSRSDLQLQVLVCKSFTGSHTWDGIDVNGHRAAGEVDLEVERLEGEGKEVEVFSVVCHYIRYERDADVQMGYSLGGCRFLVKIKLMGSGSSILDWSTSCSIAFFLCKA
jgi:hypothetical protein